MLLNSKGILLSKANISNCCSLQAKHAVHGTETITTSKLASNKAITKPLLLFIRKMILILLNCK